MFKGIITDEGINSGVIERIEQEMRRRNKDMIETQIEINDDNYTMAASINNSEMSKLIDVSVKRISENAEVMKHH